MADAYKYQIIARDDDQKGFEAEINDALELGWELHGSTQVTTATNNLGQKVKTCFFQAMTRPAPIPNKADATPKTKAPAKAKAKGKAPETTASPEEKTAAEPPADAAK